MVINYCIVDLSIICWLKINFQIREHDKKRQLDLTSIVASVQIDFPAIDLHLDRWYNTDFHHHNYFPYFFYDIIYIKIHFNPLPDDKDWSKLKQITDDILKCISNKKISAIYGRKHCEKNRNCLLQAISPFLTMFSTAVNL